MTADERIVARQIGRRPRGMIRVESRCAFGYPVSISVEPLVADGRGKGPREPFPTLFWLTCPALVEKVSRLEAAGLVGGIEAEAARDPELAARIRADHERYAAERFALLRGARRREAERRGLLAVLRDSGVGGSRDLRFVKCLHAHYAHHRARGGNAVGGILDARHGPRECAPDAIRCDAFGIRPGGRRRAPARVPSREPAEFSPAGSPRRRPGPLRGLGTGFANGASPGAAPPAPPGRIGRL